MTPWIVGSLIIGVIFTAITLIWWKVGDLWADAEHQRFGPRAADPGAPKPTVIRTKKDDDDAESDSES